MYRNTEKGFTLVELLIAMVISVILFGAIYSVYQAQQKTYVAQNQVTEMQQNLRVGMDVLLREIRMAAYDPTKSAGAGIKAVTNLGRFTFSQDLNGDGDTNDSTENLIFGFSNVNDSGIAGGGVANGIAVNGAASLGRDSNGGGFMSIAEDIAAVEFNYTLENGTETTVVPASQLRNIRSVEISLLARARRSDPKFANTMTYTTGSGRRWGPFDDRYRRRLLITTVQCRNMGLE